jgi:hypothetical protein
MVAVRDNEDRDLLGDDRYVICERPRAEHPGAGGAGGKLSAASRHLHDAVGAGGGETPDRGVQRRRRGDIDGRDGVATCFGGVEQLGVLGGGGGERQVVL